MHRDVKPENILLCQKVAKLADLGCSAKVDTRRRTFCGTLDYLCPEIIDAHEQNQSVDVWALGILIFELLTKQTPFYYPGKNETFRAIKNE